MATSSNPNKKLKTQSSVPSDDMEYIQKARRNAIAMLRDKKALMVELNKALNAAQFTPKEEEDLMLNATEIDAQVTLFYDRGIQPSWETIIETVGLKNAIIYFIDAYPYNYDVYQYILSNTQSKNVIIRLLKMVRPENPDAILPLIDVQYWRHVLKGKPVSFEEALDNSDAITLQHMEGKTPNNNHIIMDIYIKQKQYQAIVNHFANFSIDEKRIKIINKLIMRNIPVEVLVEIAKEYPNSFDHINESSSNVQVIQLLRHHNSHYQVFNSLTINNIKSVTELLRLGYKPDRYTIENAIDMENLAVLKMFLNSGTYTIPYSLACNNYLILKFLLTNYPPPLPSCLLAYTQDSHMETLIRSFPDRPTDDYMYDLVVSDAADNTIRNALNKDTPITFKAVKAVLNNPDIFPFLMNNITLNAQQQLDLVVSTIKMNDESKLDELFAYGVKPSLISVLNIVGANVPVTLILEYPKDRDIYNQLAQQSTSPELLEYLYAAGVAPRMIPPKLELFQNNPYWYTRFTNPNSITLDMAVKNQDGWMVSGLWRASIHKLHERGIIGVIKALLRSKIYPPIVDLLYALNPSSEQMETIISYTNILNSSPDVIKVVNELYPISPNFVDYVSDFRLIQAVIDVNPELKEYILNDSSILSNKSLVAQLLQAGYPVTAESIEIATSLYMNIVLKMLVDHAKDIDLPYHTAAEANNLPAIKMFMNKQPMDIDDLQDLASEYKLEDITEYVNDLRKEESLETASNNFLDLYNAYIDNPSQNNATQLYNFLLNTSGFLIPFNMVIKLPTELRTAFNKAPKKYLYTRK